VCYLLRNNFERRHFGEIMFSTKHIIVLILCILYIIGITLLLKKKNVKIITSVRWLGLVGLITETLKLGCYIVENEEEYGGYLPKTDLPLHLCSLQLLFIIVILLNRNEKVRRVLYSFMMPSCLIGGIAAIILPPSSALNMPVITVQYFWYHASIITFAIYLMITSEIRFKIRDYAIALTFLGSLFYFAVYLNSLLNDYEHNINFMYVVNPPVDGLPFLNKDNGWRSYIIRYTVVAVTSVSLCYTKTIVKAIAYGISALKKKHGKTVKTKYKKLLTSADFYDKIYYQNNL